MTTTLPVPLLLSGSWVVEDFRRPVAALGSFGMRPLWDSGGLSAIVLSAGVDSENREWNVGRLGRRQEAMGRAGTVGRFAQGQEGESDGGAARAQVFGMEGKVGHVALETFYRIQRGFALD
jgi:hypothetical protein